jgi:thioredoxin 1
MNRLVLLAVALMIAVSKTCASPAGPSKSSQGSEPAVQKKQDGPLPGSALAKCLKSGRPTMADFGRGWCKPCKAMVPVLKQAAQDYRAKANIVFVEMGEYGKLARQHRIAFMPTQIFFDAKGKEMSRHIGYLDNKGINEQFAKMGVKK